MYRMYYKYQNAKACIGCLSTGAGAGGGRVERRSSGPALPDRSAAGGEQKPPHQHVHQRPHE